MPCGGGAGVLTIGLDPGHGHYYLVTASNCMAESSLGARSDDVPRPALPMSCGALR